MGIGVRDAPAARAQGHADGSADESQSGDERAGRGAHQGDIRSIVRLMTCDLMRSKYGRCTVTLGRFIFGSISAARYLPCAFGMSVLTLSCFSSESIAFTSVCRSPVGKYAAGFAALRLLVASGATLP